MRRLLTIVGQFLLVVLTFYRLLNAGNLIMLLNISKLYETCVEIVFGIILFIIMIGIGIGAVQLLFDLWELLKLEGITGQYLDLIVDVLTLYVLVELSRSLFEYFETKKLRMTFILDGALVFIIREILIGLFKHDLKPEMIYALSALILVLGIIRIGSAMTYLKEKQMPGETGQDI